MGSESMRCQSEQLDLDTGDLEKHLGFLSWSTPAHGQHRETRRRGAWGLMKLISDVCFGSGSEE